MFSTGDFGVAHLIITTTHPYTGTILYGSFQKPAEVNHVSTDQAGVSSFIADDSAQDTSVLLTSMDVPIVSDAYFKDDDDDIDGAQEELTEDKPGDVTTLLLPEELKDAAQEVCTASIEKELLPDVEVIVTSQTGPAVAMTDAAAAAVQVPCNAGPAPPVVPADSEPQMIAPPVVAPMFTDSFIQTYGFSCQETMYTHSSERTVEQQNRWPILQEVQPGDIDGVELQTGNVRSFSGEPTRTNFRCTALYSCRARVIGY